MMHVRTTTDEFMANKKNEMKKKTIVKKQVWLRRKKEIFMLHEIGVAGMAIYQYSNVCVQHPETLKHMNVFSVDTGYHRKNARQTRQFFAALFSRFFYFDVIISLNHTTKLFCERETSSTIEVMNYISLDTKRLQFLSFFALCWKKRSDKSKIFR